MHCEIIILSYPQNFNSITQIGPSLRWLLLKNTFLYIEKDVILKNVTRTLWSWIFTILIQSMFLETKLKMLDVNRRVGNYWPVYSRVLTPPCAKCPKMYLHTILLNIFIIIQINIKLAVEIHLIILIHRYTINIF